MLAQVEYHLSVRASKRFLCMWGSMFEADVKPNKTEKWLKVNIYRHSLKWAGKTLLLILKHNSKNSICGTLNIFTKHIPEISRKTLLFIVNVLTLVSTAVDRSTSENLDQSDDQYLSPTKKNLTYVALTSTWSSLVSEKKNELRRISLTSKLGSTESLGFEWALRSEQS